MKLVRGTSGLVCVLVCLATAAANAEETQVDAAKQLYAQGKEAFEQMKYQLAYDRFKEAYALSHQAELLFNMSSAEQGMGHPKAAAELLRAYLRVMPDDPDRPGIERRIRALDEQELLDQKPEVKPLPPPPPEVKPPPPPPVVVKRWWQDAGGHVLFIGGVAVLAAGGALLAVGNSRVGQLDGQPNYGSYLTARDGATPLQYAGIGMLGAGGALALGGVIRFVVAGRRHRATVSAQLSPSGAALMVHGSF